MKNIVFKLQEAIDQPFSEVGRYPSEILHYSEYGLKIPESLIIPSGTIWKHFSDCKLAEIWSEQISKLDINSIDAKTLSQLSDPITEQILKSDFSEEIRIELSKGYSNLSSFSDSFVNIRFCTDSPIFDFNKTEKRTNIKSFDNVVKAIKEVLASIFQSELLYDFYSLQISPFTLELPILIQKSIQSEVSGIAFNLSPIDHDLEKIQIEAIVGNIDPLLNHEIIPDNYVLKKDTLEIIDQFISKQEWMQIRSNPKQSEQNTNIKIAVSKNWQNKPKLEHKFVLELAECIRSISQNNPMASVQLNWGLENQIFWLYDVKDLLKIESNINRGFNRLGLNELGSEQNVHDIEDDVEIVRPKTIELFESSFLDDSENGTEESTKSNINFEEKKPSRKGIVIKNNEVVDPGESTTISSNGIPQEKNIIQRNKAKQILYGKDKRNSNENLDDKNHQDNEVTDTITNENISELKPSQNSQNGSSINPEKSLESDNYEEIRPNEPMVAKVNPNPNESNKTIDNPSNNSDISTNEIVAEKTGSINNDQIEKHESIPEEEIINFILPYIRYQRIILSKKIKTLLKQKEAYDILYKNNSKNKKITNEDSSPIQSSKVINLISKPSETQSILHDNFENPSIALKPANQRTVTKLFIEIPNINNIIQEEIIESDGGILIEFIKTDIHSDTGLLNFVQLFAPKTLIYKISNHQDIKYTSSNIASIDEDLKVIKSVRSKNIKNLHICIPFLKSPEEFEFFREYFYNYGVKQSHNLKLFISIDNIFAVHNVEKFVESGVDGVIFNVEEILRISLGLTKEKFTEQKDIVMNEYKISETGIKDMIDNASAVCKKRKIPFILNLSTFTGENLDDLSSLAVKNHSFGLQIQSELIEKLKTVVKYYEAKYILKLK